MAFHNVIISEMDVVDATAEHPREVPEEIPEEVPQQQQARETPRQTPREIPREKTRKPHDPKCGNCMFHFDNCSIGRIYRVYPG